jgi:hypothetical protein
MHKAIQQLLAARGSREYCFIRKRTHARTLGGPQKLLPQQAKASELSIEVLPPKFRQR